MTIESIVKSVVWCNSSNTGELQKRRYVTSDIYQTTMLYP